MKGATRIYLLQRHLTVIAVLLGGLLTLAPVCSAQQLEPDELVRTVSHDVLAILDAHRDDTGSTEVLDQIRDTVLPHFDFPRMAALAAGLPWRTATPEQKNELTAQFRTLLIRTYSSALGKYRGLKIEFDPQRKSPDGRKAIVRSRVIQPGAEAITVDYRMSATATGWKVYDVSVDGVSLVTTYRDAFADESRRSGMAGLVRMLQDKNAALATGKDT